MRGPASLSSHREMSCHTVRQRRWLAVACLLALSPGLDVATPARHVLAQDAKPATPAKPEAKPDAKPDAKPESTPEALALYSDAASFQNNMAFDLAVEEWAKFLAKFPQDPLASKAQHYLGVCQLQLKEFAKAAAAFEAVLKANPKFELLEEATFNLGLSYYSQASAATPKPYGPASSSSIRD